jgi:hemerythrin
MATLKWSSRHKLDVPEVDAQHRRWFGLTGAFLDLAQSHQADAAVVEAALADAVDYAKQHFASEEALMRRVRFPESEYKRHCTMHKTFAARAESMAERWVLGQPVEATEVAAFMRGWLVGHILSADIKYIGFYLSAEAELEQRGSRGRRRS